jgi:hypothetical protein
LGETLALRFAEGAQRFIVERSVKGDSRGVQTLDDGNVEALLRDQHFNIPAPERSWNGRVEERLGKKSASECERPNSWFIRALPALDTGKPLDLQVGEGRGTKNEPSSSCLFEREPRLDDFGILFQRARERGIERDRIRVYHME